MYLGNGNKIIQFLEARFAFKLIQARTNFQRLNLGIPAEFCHQVFWIILNRTFSFSVGQWLFVYEWDEIITVHWVLRLSKTKLMTDPENWEMEEIKQVDAILLDKKRLRLSRCNSSAVSIMILLPPLKSVKAKFREWGESGWEKKAEILPHLLHSFLCNCSFPSPWISRVMLHHTLCAYKGV